MLGFIYAIYMALIDTFMLGLIKAISLGWLSSAAMIFPTVMYALQPWIFATSLKHESMTVMNLLWDVISDVMVTASGLVFFKEKLTNTKLLGVCLAIIAVTLMAWPGKELI